MLDRLRDWRVQGALLAVGLLAAYGASLGGSFVSDDWPQIAQNPFLETLTNLPRAFAQGVWASSALDQADRQFYRPLYVVWNMALKALFGPAPWAFHIGSLLLHGANTALVWLLARRLWPQADPLSWGLAAGLFAFHPTKVESVAWISGATDPLLTLFVLLAMLGYLSGRFGLALLAFAAALLVKETAAMLLFVLALLSRLREGAVPWRRLALFLLALLAYLGLRQWALGGEGPRLSFTPEGFLRLADFLALSLRYLVLPDGAPFYFAMPPHSAGTVERGLGLLVLLGLAGLAWRVAEARGPILAFLLVLAVPLLGAFHAKGVFALRNLYLPSVFLALLVPALDEAFPKTRPALVAGLAVLLPIGLVLSHLFAADWRDEGVFFAQVVRSDPKGGSGYSGLAKFHLREKRLDRALAVWKEGAEKVRAPEDRLAFLEAIGVEAGRAGRAQESVAAYLILALEHPDKSIAQIGLGNNALAQERFQAAREHYRQALSVAPDAVEALMNGAFAAERLGLADEASAYYARLLTLPESQVPPPIRAQAARKLGR
ncbi:MAG: hypothetical protein IT565_12545 [Rhodospirillales bacterium]|nr:hypothetical protein [Rhodospirillales bacterium]